MSRFFVGQRVRLVKPYRRENFGCEGRIESLFPERDSSVAGWPVNCTVSGAVSGIANHTSRLEPILPEGHCPCEDQFKRELDKLLEGVLA